MGGWGCLWGEPHNGERDGEENIWHLESPAEPVFVPRTTKQWKQMLPVCCFRRFNAAKTTLMWRRKPVITHFKRIKPSIRLRWGRGLGRARSHVLREAENWTGILVFPQTRLHVCGEHPDVAGLVLLSNQHADARRIEPAAHLTAPLYLGLIKVIEVAP